MREIIPLQFTSIVALPDGKVSLGVTGDPGFNVQLQTSTNLLNPSETPNCTNEPVVEVPYQFFRALYP